MSMVIEAREPSAPAPVARRAAGPRAPADLVFVDMLDPATARRALRMLDCVKAVALRDGRCQVWAEPGTAPLIVDALRGEGLAPAVVTLQWWQDSPRQALRPSCTAIAAKASAATASTHHQPRALSASPASTAPAIAPQRRFWMPSPAVAGEPSRAPRRRFARPNRGIVTKLIVVTTTPSTVGSGL